MFLHSREVFLIESPSASSISRGDEFEMRSNRPYVQFDPAVIEQARQMDLLTYLQHYEPSDTCMTLSVSTWSGMAVRM